MGTTYTVSIPRPPAALNKAELETEIQHLLEDINRKMSTYIADSELSLLNNSTSTDWQPVSPELYEVISAAMQISQKTDGAFDITVGNLVNLWGFGPQPGNQAVPTAEEITMQLSSTGYKQIELAALPPSIRKHHGDIRMDLSAIAKGYAVDRLANMLEQKLIRDYMVEIGGEIRTGGINLKGETWRIGIEKPVVNQRAVQTIIALQDKGMATSGDYRNYFEYSGSRYSHEIDPRTGWPVSHPLRSVTVVGDTAMIADALSTALMVMGPEQAYRFAERESIAALFILSEGDQFQQRYTSPLAANLVQ